MRLLALALLLLSLPCAARDAATDRTAATARAAAATRSAWVGTNALRGYDARGPADSTYARGRLVRNLLAGAYDPNAAGWSLSVTTGTGSGADAGGGAYTITSTTDGAARIFIARTYASLVVGQSYALCATIASTGGAVGSFSLGISTAPGAGEQRVITNSNGRWCIRLTADATSEVIRIGFGITGDETTANGDTITISKVQLEEIAALTTVPSEFCDVTACRFNFALTSSIASNVLTYDAQTDYQQNRADVVLVVGDSFCNDSSEFADLIRSNHRREVHKSCTAGNRLDQIATAASAWLAAPTTSEQSGVLPTVMVIEGGINDIVQDASAATVETRADALIAIADAAGMIPVVVLPGPFEAFASHSVGRQTVMDDYRASMLARTDVLVADMYPVLEDPSNADALAAGYDSGDGLHPNAAGSAVVANLINAALARVQRGTTQ